jgi:hypothetical protein
LRAKDVQVKAELETSKNMKLNKTAIGIIFFIFIKHTPFTVFTFNNLSDGVHRSAGQSIMCTVELVNSSLLCSLPKLGLDFLDDMN